MDIVRWFWRDWRGGRSERAGVVAAAAVLHAVAGVGAQESPVVDPKAAAESPPVEDGPASLAAAHLAEATRFQKEGGCGRAVAFYVAAGAAHNTADAALGAARCWFMLRRPELALQSYERAMYDFEGQLSEDQRTAVKTRMNRLNEGMGRLAVIANVPAGIAVDGYYRGPLDGAPSIPLMAGQRKIRVGAPGYQSIERTVEIKVGQELEISLRLEALSEAAELSVGLTDSLNEPDAFLYVDGLLMGGLPWRGQLEPGERLVHVERFNLGTAPRRVSLKPGAKGRVRLTVAPLGPVQRLSVAPEQAKLSLGETRLSDSVWMGRLPVGRHSLTAQADGYLPTRQLLQINPDEAPDVAVELEPDPADPRWRIRKVLGYDLELVAGPLVSWQQGSGAERACDSMSCSDALVYGVLVGARLGRTVFREYQDRFHAELFGGYLGFGTNLSRSYRGDQALGGQRAEYRIDDQLRVSGGLVALSASYFHAFSKRLELGVRFGLSLWISSARHAVSAAVSLDDETLPGIVDQAGARQFNASVVLWPELLLSYQSAPWRFGTSLGSIAIVTTTRRGPHGDVLQSPTSSEPGACTELGCAQASGRVAGERPFGRMLGFVPTGFVSYDF